MQSRRKSSVESLEARRLLSLTALGGEFRANTTVAGDQYAPAVASDGAGDFVIVWVSPDADRAGTDIYAQRYNAGGVTVGSEFRINTLTAGSQAQPDVAMDDAGNFVVAWTSANVSGGSGRDVVSRRFSNTGAALDASESLVNTTVSGTQESPAIAADAAGNFIVAWDSDSADGSDYGIVARTFNAAGIATSGETLINTSTAGPQTDPSVDMNRRGDYVIAWSSAASTSSSDYDIYARTYSVATASLSAQTFVNNVAGYTSDYQVLPAVAIDDSGNSIIAWSSYATDGSNYGIYARQYSSALSAGTIFRVNTYTSGQQTHAAIDVSADGAFTIAWDSANQDGSGRGVFAQSYSLAGAKVGGETRVNTTTANDQSYPAITLNADGDAIITWQDGSTAINGNGADGSGYGVFAQRFGNPPTVTAANYNYLQGQSLTFTFNEDVGASLSLADLTVTNITTGQVLPTANLALSYNAATYTATVNFNGYLYGLSPNGNYTAALTAAGVTDASGTTLDGDGDGSAGGDYTLSYFVLAGDLNRDRIVDIGDLGVLATNWQKTSQNYSTGDITGDGKVDISDLGILATNWQMKLPPPTPAVITATARRRT